MGAGCEGCDGCEGMGWFGTVGGYGGAGDGGGAYCAIATPVNTQITITRIPIRNNVRGMIGCHLTGDFMMILPTCAPG